MTIQNWEEYKSNLWDWGILKGCFMDTKIEPTDIDGFVERNGKFLVIETKAPGVEVKTGQSITFKRLIDTGKFTVMIVWGEANNPQKIKLITRRTTLDYDDATLDTMKSLVSKWFLWANQAPTGKE